MRRHSRKSEGRSVYAQVPGAGHWLSRHVVLTWPVQHMHRRRQARTGFWHKVVHLRWSCGRGRGQLPCVRGGARECPCGTHPGPNAGAHVHVHVGRPGHATVHAPAWRGGAVEVDHTHWHLRTGSAMGAWEASAEGARPAGGQVTGQAAPALRSPGTAPLAHAPPAHPSAPPAGCGRSLHPWGPRSARRRCPHPGPTSPASGRRGGQQGRAFDKRGSSRGRPSPCALGRQLRCAGSRRASRRDLLTMTKGAKKSVRRFISALVSMRSRNTA